MKTFIPLILLLLCSLLSHPARSGHAEGVRMLSELAPVGAGLDAHAPTAQPVQRAKERAAGLLAARLDSDDFRTLLTRVAPGGLHPLTALGLSPDDPLNRLDLATRHLKDIENESTGLLALRLYRPAGDATVPDPGRLLVAWSPGGNERDWRQVDAFDSRGQRHVLDAARPPDRPVLIVQVDGREEMRAAAASRRLMPPPGAGTDRQVWHPPATEALRLDRISVRNTQESWISGPAEVYAVLSGLRSDRHGAQLDIVSLPYLQYENIAYTPYQTLLFWRDYRYGMANLQLFEHDDNVSYKEVIQNIVQAVGAVVRTAEPSLSLLTTMASAIIQSLPDRWYMNEDDYLDSFYSLEKSRSYTALEGTSGNATISLRTVRYQGVASAP